MNATELFIEGGKSAGIYFCGKCRNVARSQHLAEQCCQDYKCDLCGASCGRSWTRCESCREKAELAKEAARFEAAAKVPPTEHDGWVYLDSAGFKDGYFDCIDDFLDWASSEIEPEDWPKYIWACKEHQFVQADVSDITERIGDEAYEDFDTDDLNGMKELKVALAEFNAKNASFKSYSPDYSKAIILPSWEEAFKSTAPSA